MWLVLLPLACQDYDLKQTERDPGRGGDSGTTPVETDTGTVTTDSDPTSGTTLTGDSGEVASEPVYLNTGDALYSYDPGTNTATRIGAFTEGGRAVSSMTDIAIDPGGRMYGGSFEALYRINPTTAEVTHVADLADEMTGLTFVSDGRLVGAGARVSFVDTTTGRLTELVPTGRYSTSGDIVGLPDGMLYWSVTGGDLLIQVDPNTGTTTRIGNLGTSAVYGLGYAYEQLYGFTSGGRMLAIDATDADASSQRLEGAWWGATTNPVLW